MGYVRRLGQTSRISRLWQWFSITSLAMEFMKTHLFLKFNWNSLVLYHSDLWVWKLKLFVCMVVWSSIWGWELFLLYLRWLVCDKFHTMISSQSVINIVNVSCNVQQKKRIIPFDVIANRLRYMFDICVIIEMYYRLTTNK